MTSDLECSKTYLAPLNSTCHQGRRPRGPAGQEVQGADETGENIPFRRFSCSSLQAFLQSVPDVCRVTVRGGAVVVEGVATAETKHIKEMVKMQGLHPAARTRGNGSGGGGGRGKYFQSKPPPSFSTNHHLAQSSEGKWQSPGQRSSPSQAAVQSPRGASGSPASSSRAYSNNVNMNNANIVVQPFPKPDKKPDLPPENQMKTNPKYLRGQIKSIHTTPPSVTRSAGSQNNNAPRSHKEYNDQVSRPPSRNVTSSLSVTIPNHNVMNGGTGQVKSLPLPSVHNGGEYYDLRVSHVVSAAEIYVQSYVSLQRYYTMDHGPRDGEVLRRGRGARAGGGGAGDVRGSEAGRGRLEQGQGGGGGCSSARRPRRGHSPVPGHTRGHRGLDHRQDGGCHRAGNPVWPVSSPGIVPLIIINHTNYHNLY